MRIVTERETGRPAATAADAGAVRWRSWPRMRSPALTVLLASLAVQVTVARLAFHFTVKGSPLGLVRRARDLGGLALIPIGLVAGSVARDSKTAPAITNFLFFPMMFLSGRRSRSRSCRNGCSGWRGSCPRPTLVESLQGIIVRACASSSSGIAVVSARTDLR